MNDPYALGLDLDNPIEAWLGFLLCKFIKSLDVFYLFSGFKNIQKENLLRTGAY